MAAMPSAPLTMSTNKQCQIDNHTQILWNLGQRRTDSLAPRLRHRIARGRAVASSFLSWTSAKVRLKPLACLLKFTPPAVDPIRTESRLRDAAPDFP
jgi:hypothetical protein